MTTKTMTTKTNKREQGRLYRAAIVRPETLDEESRTVELVFSTGAEVQRGYYDTFFESLSLDPAHVRLDRLNSGAPLLNTHSVYALSSVLGVVESARTDGKTGVATVRFSKRADVEPFFRDVQDGIIRNVSIGYWVYKYLDITETQEVDTAEQEIIRKLQAIDWEPFEISLLAVGADAGAQTRQGVEEEKKFTILENSRMDEKPKPVEPAPDQTASPPVSETPTAPPIETETRAAEVEAAIKADRIRAASIREYCRRAAMPADFEEKLVLDGVSVESARGLILEAVLERDASATKPKNHVRVEAGGLDATETYREAVSGAMLFRAMPGRYKDLIEPARRFRSCSLLEMAKDALARAGVNVELLSRGEIATRALHSTSDFPKILANVAKKTLYDGYNSRPQTFLPFVNWISAADFKLMYPVMFGEAPTLQETSENAEFKQGTIDESGESYKLKTWGRIANVTRQVILNDDLQAFTRLPFSFGVRALKLEGDIFWGLVTANAAMADGNALFSTAHANLAGAGAVISVTTLSAARLAMRTQTMLDGSTPAEIEPRFLVVPAALETVAEQYLAQSARANADQPANYNPFGGAWQLAVESRLDADSAIKWYVFSTADETAMVEMATLDGMRGPELEERWGFEVDGYQLKARYDINGCPVDHRGVYQNPGA